MRSGKEYICKNCGKKYKTSRTYKGKVFCSRDCFIKYRTGKKFPHTKEWEEKRIKALRAVSYKLKGFIPPNKGKRGGSLVECKNCGKLVYRKPYLLLEGKNFFCSRECSFKYHRGENVYNWKGGTNVDLKHQWIRENSARFKKWRQMVLERDNHQCRLCGAKNNLEVHHIIPFSLYPELVDLKMNGITLCHNCHKKTDSYGIDYKKYRKTDLYKTVAMMFVIPHGLQAYETVGNYEWTNNNILVIFVSDLGNEDYEHAIFIHEFIEASLCKKRGIKEEDITNFDIQFEKDRLKGLHSKTAEPGNSPKAPYHREHLFATKLEKMFIKDLGYKWKEYDRLVNEL
jgi:5-methylcytosine-specific restriction endonuclease McrA